MLIRLSLVLVLVAAACSSGAGDPSVDPGEVLVAASDERELVDSEGSVIPAAPEVESGPLSEAALVWIAAVWDSLSIEVNPDPVRAFGAVGDARIAWLLSDLLRFFQGGPVGDAAVAAFEQLTGVVVPLESGRSPWGAVTDLLIAWDLEAPPGYAEYKQRLFTLVDPGWQPFFADTTADVDWRLVSWGGVRIDNRPLGDLAQCALGCIPALDDPPVTDAAGGAWYPDDGIVFAVDVNGEARAYPKNIMEVHEMVNDTLGGRRIGMPYCTLCGAAQAFFTDEVSPGEPSLVLRTSGLLSRSNKVMYELGTKSMFDTFLGVALTGPLREAGVVLTPVTVVTTTWGDWKLAHPDTTIIAQDGGRGIDYPADPLRGRDDDGPIFPVGDVDPRLAVQEQVLGVVSPGGDAVAFPVAAAREVLEAGGEIVVGEVRLLLDGGGIRATTGDGSALSTHQAFWFAWSQFRSDTLVWEPEPAEEEST